MLKKTLFGVFVFVILSLQTVFSQGLINGTVVDVVDGRTLVVSNATGQLINVRLRFLEVPEPEQQLSDVVKNHLKDLASGKKIYVTKVQVFSNYTLGVGIIKEKTKEFDLTQQMIRDGAGWFDIYDASSATDESTSDYKETELLAKNEKRGVWGIAGMKTPWEYRDEKNKKTTTDISATTNKPVKKTDDMSLAEMVGNSSRTTNGGGKLAIYDFVSKTAKPVSETTTEKFESSDLDQRFDSNSGKGSVSTNAYEFSIQNGKTNQKLKLVIGYHYSVQNSNKKLNNLVLVVVSKIDGLTFLKGKNVSLVLDDGKKVSLGVPRYAVEQGVEGYRFENLNLNSILSIPESSSMTLVIGKFKKKLDNSYKQSVDDIVNTLK
jgi:endonuclease YncB( thermonuclease family)